MGGRAAAARAVERERGVEALVALLREGREAATRAQAARALRAVVGAHGACADAAVRAGGVAAVVALLRDRDDDCRAQAAALVEQFAGGGAGGGGAGGGGAPGAMGREQLRQLRGMFSMVKGNPALEEALRSQLAASLPPGMSAAQAEQVFRALSESAGPGDGEGSDAAGDDSGPSVAADLVRAGAVPALVSAMRGGGGAAGGAECKANAAAALAKLVGARPACMEAALRAGAAAAVVSLVRDAATDEVRVPGAKLLALIAMTAEGSALHSLAHAGAIPALVAVMRDCRDGMGRMAATGALASMGFREPGLQVDTMRAGALLPALELLRAGYDEAVQEQAHLVLGNIAAHPENASLLWREHVDVLRDQLLPLLRAGSPMAKYSAASAFADLVKGRDKSLLLLRLLPGVIPAAVALLKAADSNAGCRKEASRLLSNLVASADAAHAPVLAAGAAEALVAQLGKGDSQPAVKIMVAQALAELAQTNAGRARIVQANAL